MTCYSFSPFFETVALLTLSRFKVCTMLQFLTVYTRVRAHAKALRKL